MGVVDIPEIGGPTDDAFLLVANSDSSAKHLCIRYLGDCTVTIREGMPSSEVKGKGGQLSGHMPTDRLGSGELVQKKAHFRTPLSVGP